MSIIRIQSGIFWLKNRTFYSEFLNNINKLVLIKHKSIPECAMFAYLLFVNSSKWSSTKNSPLNFASLVDIVVDIVWIKVSNIWIFPVCTEY